MAELIEKLLARAIVLPVPTRRNQGRCQIALSSSRLAQLMLKMLLVNEYG
jgi:hypothetical protein